MPQRHPNPGAQQVAPKGFPGDGARRRSDPLLPRLPAPQLRASSGAGGSGSSRALGSDAGWWQAPRCASSHTEPGVGVRSPLPRLPALPTVAPRAAQDRTGLRSLLLPPLLLARAPRAPAPPRRGPGECEDPRRGSAKEAPDSLGALLGELLLPSRFRGFLRQLGVEHAEEQPQPPSEALRRPQGAGQGRGWLYHCPYCTDEEAEAQGRVTRKSVGRTVPKQRLITLSTSSWLPASPHQRGVSEHCRRCPQCPNYSFLPDLRGKSSYFRNSLKKILLHQIPALGPLKRDHSQFTTVKKANHSSGEGSGPRRRCYPFRVRFADETLRDTALRYWERSCAVWQGSLEKENGTATQSAASERVFRSVGRWLESLPKTLYSRAVEEATARPCLSRASVPLRPTQEPQGHFSEDASVNSSLPFIPRATTQRQRGDLKTFLGAHSILEQGGKSPSSWSQKLESFLPSLVLHTVLKRGRPKGYQLLLPSTTPQRAQR
ncbi:PREDICTED: uncharacterized protein C9orf50 homolog [Ceratotherium simum simum]|uniref:Uncharacterized protein C9orf50 homolog n=1 Tax=Ceratotherium simum simum TaxID=73337 RepID=A0ABM1CD16_CERSS|nr:PREDICTED: uncharacterized protein C9orf50 homolog [Ceratotherium simum simum]